MSFKIYKAAFFILVIVSFESYAQTKEPDSLKFILKNPTKNTTSQLGSIQDINFMPHWYKVITDVPKDIYNFGEVVTDKNNLKYIGLLTSIVISTMAWDHTAYRDTKLLTERYKSVAGITNAAVNIGDAKWQLSAAGAAIAFGYLFNDKKIINTSFESIEAVLSAGLCVQILKRFSGRQSPAVSTGRSGKWEPFPDLSEYQQKQPNFYSFPSGHIASTCAILAVINNNYPDVGWLKPVEISVLGVLGFSLVAKDMHWYSDLPVGAAVGYLFGNIVSNRYHRSQSNISKDNNSISFLPMISDREAGVMLSYSFN